MGNVIPLKIGNLDLRLIVQEVIGVLRHQSPQWCQRSLDPNSKPMTADARIAGACGTERQWPQWSNSS